VPPTREELFEQIRACNFFACTLGSPDKHPIEHPELEVEDGEIVMSVRHPVDSITFFGRDGRELSRAEDTTVARYRPSGDEKYVRARARRMADQAECLSQAVWLYRSGGQ